MIQKPLRPGKDKSLLYILVEKNLVLIQQKTTFESVRSLFLFGRLY